MRLQSPSRLCESEKRMNGDIPDNSTQTFRPALRSMWFLFFGLILGPAVIIFERDPDGGAAKWVVLSLVCLGLILHRLSLKYTLDSRELSAESWWGLGRKQIVTLAQISEVYPAQGVSGRLMGCGHLEIKSRAPDEPGLIILGQPDYLGLARHIEARAHRAGSGTADV